MVSKPAAVRYYFVRQETETLLRCNAEVGLGEAAEYQHVKRCVIWTANLGRSRRAHAQGSTKRWALGFVNTAGKLKQKW